MPQLDGTGSHGLRLVVRSSGSFLDVRTSVDVGPVVHVGCDDVGRGQCQQQGGRGFEVEDVHLGLVKASTM